MKTNRNAQMARIRQNDAMARGKQNVAAVMVWRGIRRRASAWINMRIAHRIIAVVNGIINFA